MATLDPELETLLQRSNYYRQHPEAAAKNPAAVPDDQQVLQIAVSFTGDTAPLIEVGFQIESRFTATAYGSILLRDLHALATLPAVQKISKQRRKNLQLTTSIPDIRADEVWNFASEAFSGITGQGVIVGIIDTGINFRHESFQTTTGTTRILRIWDQTLTKTGAESTPQPITDTAIGAIPLNYGVEYNQQQINQKLQGVNDFVRHEDAHGHGTHVAGIAAGNGRQAGSCKGRYSYIGVAPEADLIVVRLCGLTEGDNNPTSSSSGYMIDAISYILNMAKHEFHKPVAINLSLGSFTDNMDGSSPDCVTMNNLLNHADNDEGFVIVLAAGNEANSNFHARTLLEPGATPFDLKFRVFPQDRKSRSLSILYEGGQPEIRISSPVSGTDGILDWIAPGEFGISTTANGSNTSRPDLVPELTVTHTTPGRIFIRLTPKIDLNSEGEPNESSSRYNMPGDWVISLRNTGSATSTIEAYCLYGSGHDRRSVHFLNDTTIQTTLSEEATAEAVITVGSYNAANGRLADSSGRGMTSDLRQKPEITAPGVGVMSAGIAKDLSLEGCCCDCCHDYYVTKGGTSMAAPHVTGAAALLLNKNGNLTHQQVLNSLVSHARPHPTDASLDDALGWGVGKLDIKQAIDPVSAGGGSPAGPHAPFYRPATGATESSQLFDGFKRSPRGQEYLQLFRQYFKEIRDLVNRNKRVATVWHRNKGPLWLRSAIQAGSNPELVLPETIEDISLKTAIEKMWQMLRRYGSAGLSADLDRYAPTLLQLEGGQNLQQIMEQVMATPTAAHL